MYAGAIGAGIGGGGDNEIDMSVHSMTGFARAEGRNDTASWFFELRSVNGKGLDVRLRLPTGLEALEAKLRTLAGAKLARGTLHVSLSIARSGSAVEVRLNEELLEQVLTAARKVSAITGGALPGTGELLMHRGVLESVDKVTEDSEAFLGDLIADFEAALDDLVAARAAEGVHLASAIGAQIDEIERLTAQVEASPARSVQAIRAKLWDQVSRLMENQQSLDADRLHQEAVLIATRADVEEELKRLRAHVAAGRDLLAKGGPIGRKLDFLAQEFQREANTLCSKSSDTSITEAGLALKVKIDQMREQVQNLE